MKRVSELLEKKIVRNFSPDSREQVLVRQFAKDWQIQKQPLPLKTKWDLIRASVILQGVSNKIAIEKAYIRIMDGMENYWKVLDYQERVRLLNIDLKPVYDDLPSFEWEDAKMVIPFFDQRLNHIYQNEMAVFSLKQYQYLMHTYQQWIQPVTEYGLAYYNGTYVPAFLIRQEGMNYVLYHAHMKTLFAHLDNMDLVFPLFDGQMAVFEPDDNQLDLLAKDILKRDPLAYLEHGVQMNLYSAKLTAAIRKKLEKKSWFFR